MMEPRVLTYLWILSQADAYVFYALAEEVAAVMELRNKADFSDGKKKKKKKKVPDTEEATTTAFTTIASPRTSDIINLIAPKVRKILDRFGGTPGMQRWMKQVADSVAGDVGL